jgi:cellulose synthase operon protein C
MGFRSRPLLVVALLASLAASATSCAKPPPPRTPTDKAREQGPDSNDPEVVGRWLFGEMVAKGGTAEEAKKARGRLEKLNKKGMMAAVAVGTYDAFHGQLSSGTTAFVDALIAAKSSRDPLAPLVAWYASNRLLIASGTPEVKAALGPSLLGLIEQPGGLGWRPRGELVDLWSRLAIRNGERDLLERTTKMYGCATQVRLAGPFGHGAGSDRWISFPAEKPGPWPARWEPHPLRTEVPRILKTDRSGCTVRVDEPMTAGIVYGETYIEVKDTREVIVAALGALSLWVDDAVVLERDPRTWGIWPKFGAHLRLGPGRHRIVAKVAGPETFLRVLNPDGTPADVAFSTDAAAPYVTRAPEVVGDPNVLGKYLADGRATPPSDPVEAYLSAYVASVEGQYDVADVLMEPLIQDTEHATALSLANAAVYAEKDPIFPESEARDLAHGLREKASAKDPGLYGLRIALAIDTAEKSNVPEAVKKTRAMIDEFPEVPDVWLALGALYGRAGWKAERSDAVLTMAKRFPDDRGALESAIVVYEEMGRLPEADAAAKHLLDLYPDSTIALDRALARHDYDAAIAELQRIGQHRPDRKDIADRVGDLLVRKGDRAFSLQTLEKALKRNPRDTSARLQIADAKYAEGEKSALRTALATAIQQGVPTAELRNAIELVEGATELEPYRLDGPKVAREFEASKVEMDGTAARVLDYAALWIHRDGSARMLEHELIRVQSQEAIGKLTEQRVPEDALVLRMRVIKKNGAIYEPEQVPGKATYTMPHLEVGDYIETENITTTDGDGEGGRRYLGPQWFFREADIAYFRSEFLVISPRDRKLQIETRGKVPPPEEKEQAGLLTKRWRVDQSPAAVIEPGSVPVQEFLPSIRLAWGLSQEQHLARLLDGASDQAPRDPRIVKVATRIVGDAPANNPKERARRLYRWLVANVEDGREADGRRVVIGKSGNRAAGFITLARALHLPLELAAVKDSISAPPIGEIGAAFEYDDLVLRLGTEKTEQAERAAKPAPAEKKEKAFYFTVGDKYAPFGFVPPELRGQPAVRLIPSLPRETTSVEGGFDGIVYDGTVELRADGSATLLLDQRFVGRLAMSLRGSVESMPDSQLKGAVESKIVARAFPGARLAELTVVDKDDLDKPLTLRMKIEISTFARRRGQTLLLKPPLVLQMANMAPLEVRQTTMLLPEGTHTEVRLAVTVPKGATIGNVQKPLELLDGNRKLVLADSVEGDVVKIDRVLDVPAGRIEPSAYGAFRKWAIDVDEANTREITLLLP